MSEGPIEAGDIVRINSFQVAIPDEQATVVEQDGVLGAVCSLMYSSDCFMPLSILEQVTKTGEEPTNDG